jgi:putative transposase
VARGVRLDAPGGLHHVIVRGIEGRRIFETEKDREDFLDRLETVVTELRTKKWKKS